MGIREEFSTLSIKVEGIATDVKWLVDARKVELEEAHTRRTSKLWVVGIITSVAMTILIPCLLLLAGVVKNVDILCALHKPQMEIFQQGGSVVDSFKKEGAISHGKQR